MQITGWEVTASFNTTLVKVLSGRTEETGIL